MTNCYLYKWIAIVWLMSLPLKKFVKVAVGAALIVSVAGVRAPHIAEAAPAKSVYIVRLKSSSMLAPFVMQEGKYGTQITQLFASIFPGFASKLSTPEVARLRKNKKVLSVSKMGIYKVPKRTAPSSSIAFWGLDRINQRRLPLDGQTPSAGNGSGVRVYVVDTGVDLNHPEFQGRVSDSYSGIDGSSNASDCNGHGTHVAGTIAGKTSGVAPAATIVPVKVLSCNGSGNSLWILRGLDYVMADYAMRRQPSVVNLSLGGSVDPALDAAIEAMVSRGITVVVAAGNNNKSACLVSPARAPSALTVGASDVLDKRASFSNHGSCLDLFAPGVGVRSAWPGGTYRNLNGTSMAAPHVAGVAAHVLGQNPTLSPAQVSRKITDSATPGAVADARTGSPNRLLFSDSTSGGERDTTSSTTTSPANNLVFTSERFYSLSGVTINSLALRGTESSDNQLWYTVTVTDPLGRLVQSGAQLCPVASIYPNGSFCTGQAESGSGDRFQRVYGGLFWVGPGAPGGQWVVKFAPIAGGPTVSGRINLSVQARTDTTTTSTTTTSPVNNLVFTSERFYSLSGVTINSLALRGTESSDNQLWYTVTVTDPLGRLVQSGAQLCPVASIYPNGSFCTGQAESGSGDRFQRVYGGLFWVGPGAPGGQWVVKFAPIAGGSTVSGQVLLNVSSRR